MKIQLYDNLELLSEAASEFLIREIQINEKMLLCAATGSSPTGTYEKLVQKRQRFSTEHLRIIKLDEWGGVSSHHPQTCESYLQKHLIEPFNISEHNYFSFESNPEVPEMECSRIQHLLDEQGPADVCILGLGMNGHIALNEPAEQLEANCHVAHISKSSMNHPMVRGMSVAPTYGLTLGMADILKSRKILFLVSGISKAAILKELLAGKISTRLPASLLWLHPDVHCLCENQLYEAARK
jgi:galactosamine-6-phosphate isomerase